MTQPTVAVQRHGVWPFSRWIVREDAAWGDLTEQRFRSKALAIAWALDLVGDDNRLVTVNGKALGDG